MLARILKIAGNTLRALALKRYWLMGSPITQSTKRCKAPIGRPVKPVRRVRGVYCIFPSAPGTANRYNVHVDYISSHVAAMVMVDEIGPDCGGFMFWPGSHVTLHPYSQTKGAAVARSTGRAFRAAKERIVKETSSINSPDHRATSFFGIRARCIRRASIAPRRKASRWCGPLCLATFSAGLTYADDTDFGPGEDFQWWIDTRNTIEDFPTTTDNMWDDWAI